MWFKSGTTWPENGMETEHVVQREGPHGWEKVRKRNMWCRGRTTWPGKGMETGHVVQGKDHMAGNGMKTGHVVQEEGPHGRKTPNKKPG